MPCSITESARKLRQTLHSLSWAMRMRAASRTRVGRMLLLYAASLSLATAAPISGRSIHTWTASPPSPSGMSIRGMTRHYDARAASAPTPYLEAPAPGGLGGRLEEQHPLAAQ